MSLEARAREFCSGDIKKELGPWEAHQIAIRMASFAAPYEAALRQAKEENERLREENEQLRLQCGKIESVEKGATNTSPDLTKSPDRR